MRGENVLRHEDAPKEQKKKQNLHVTFGCAPKFGVKAKSVMVESFSKCIGNFIKKNGGVLVIPQAYDNFKSRYVENATFRQETTQRLYFDINGSLHASQQEEVPETFVEKTLKDLASAE